MSKFEKRIAEIKSRLDGITPGLCTHAQSDLALLLQLTAFLLSANDCGEVVEFQTLNALVEKHDAKEGK